MNRLVFAPVLALVFSSGCSGSVPPATSSASYVPAITRSAAAGRIQNVIIVVQDQRTFDNLFAGFPGADGATYGFTHAGQRVPLRSTTFRHYGCLVPSGLYGFDIAWDHGQMNGFDELDKNKPLCPYTRISESETKPYWDLAKRYTIADHTFASTYAGGFVNRQYLIAGSTRVGNDEYVIGYPTALPWGCDAPAGARTPRNHSQRKN